MTPTHAFVRLIALATLSTAASAAAVPAAATTVTATATPTSYLCAEPTTIAVDPYSVTTPEVCIPWI